MSMNKQDFIEKIETEIKNGSTDTREKTLDLIHQMYEDNEIFNYTDEALDGILVTLELNGVKVDIDWVTTETTNGVDDLYFYEIS